LRSEAVIKVVIFDLDGTIYFGDKIAEDACAVVGMLNEIGVKTSFLTNNSRRTRREIFEKLIKLGLDLRIENVYTSSYLAGRYLKDHGISSAYVFGENGLVEELKNFGVVVDDEDPECVVVGYDMTINYNKIVIAFRHILNDKLFVACNQDKSYPVESGLHPGCGAMVGAIMGCTGASPDIIVGKPSVYPVEVICKDLGIGIESVMVVGDNYESDIMMAKNAGCKSYLMAGDEKIGDCNIITSLSQLIEIVKKEGLNE
jgi:HAD superfamily hydrolase (TIGR01450 family)